MLALDGQRHCHDFLLACASLVMGGFPIRATDICQGLQENMHAIPNVLLLIPGIIRGF